MKIVYIGFLFIFLAIGAMLYAGREIEKERKVLEGRLQLLRQQLVSSKIIYKNMTRMQVEQRVRGLDALSAYMMGYLDSGVVTMAEELETSTKVQREEAKE